MTEHHATGLGEDGKRYVLYRTCGTGVTWCDLRSWLDGAIELAGRRPSSKAYADGDRHLRGIELRLVYRCENPETLRGVLDLFNATGTRNNSMCAPARGLRGDHPTTPIIVAVKNRLDQLGEVAT
jgi:hypothetical protein